MMEDVVTENEDMDMGDNEEIFVLDQGTIPVQYV